MLIKKAEILRYLYFPPSICFFIHFFSSSAILSWLVFVTWPIYWLVYLFMVVWGWHPGPCVCWARDWHSVNLHLLFFSESTLPLTGIYLLATCIYFHCIVLFIFIFLFYACGVFNQGKISNVRFVSLPYLKSINVLFFFYFVFISLISKEFICGTCFL